MSGDGSNNLAVGIYEKILDEELKELLDANSDLKPVLRKIDDELAPHMYAQFVGKLLVQALHITKKELRVTLINRFYYRKYFGGLVWT